LLTVAVCRTLLTSKAGLEHARQLVLSYKLGKIKDMNPELWRAKKVIDSTLHPGMPRSLLVAIGRRKTDRRFYRHRLTSPSPLPNVLLCHVQPRSDSRHAYAWSRCTRSPSTPIPSSTLTILTVERNLSLANNKPVAKCSHKQRKRQQIHASFHTKDNTIIPASSQRIVFCSSRSKRPRAPIEASVAGYEDDFREIGAVCGGSKCRSTECLPNAR
jgi:hypothetical protein